MSITLKSEDEGVGGPERTGVEGPRPESMPQALRYPPCLAAAQLLLRTGCKESRTVHTRRLKPQAPSQARWGHGTSTVDATPSRPSARNCGAHSAMAGGLSKPASGGCRGWELYACSG